MPNPILTLLFEERAKRKEAAWGSYVTAIARARAIGNRQESEPLAHFLTLKADRHVLPCAMVKRVSRVTTWDGKGGMEDADFGKIASCRFYERAVLLVLCAVWFV
jgi:hypothetical protein